MWMSSAIERNPLISQTMKEEEKVEGTQLEHKPKEISETIVFAFDLPKKWNTSWYFNSGTSINVNGESS